MFVRSSWPLIGAMLSAGAFGVHQLRYALAYGEGAEDALSASGHGYLAVVEPLIGLTLAFTFAYAVWRVVGGKRWQPASRRRLACGFAVTLLLVYTGQELIEGELAVGHADGLAGVFGAGGWIAVPSALIIGGLLSLGIRLADAMSEAAVVSGAGWRARPAATRMAWHGGTSPLVPRTSPLARHVAGRGPPQFLSS